MFLKKTVVNKGDERYIYGQLVESIRRKEDGKPGHRVVANLGRVDDLLVDCLQLAFRAARQGKALVLASELEHEAIRPVAHYSYLDVAVLLEQWRRWGLDELTAQLATKHKRRVPFEDVLAFLVLHQCLDPKSKIEATRWYPGTALPELLGHQPKAVNNTRIHRALKQLAEVEETLQQKLAATVQRKVGGQQAFFIDVTDTWFEGRGPDLAQSRKTKEGLWKLKIGIVMICNEEGLPLRWEVVEGRRAEQELFLAAGNWLRKCGLSQNEPIVVDRAMGHIKNLADMKKKGIKYLTALRSQAIERFVGEHQAFGLGDGVTIDSDDALKRLRLAAEEKGLANLGNGSFGADLGVLTPEVSEHLAPSPHIERSRDALALAKAVELRLDEGHASTLRQAAEQLGLKPSKASSVRPLLKLNSEIKQAIEAGRNQLSVVRLKKIAKLSHAEQLSHFELEHTLPKRQATDASSRVAIYFHPKRFIYRRKEIAESLSLLEQQLLDLNQRLATPQSRRRPGSIENEIRRSLLKPKGFESLFDIEIDHVEHNGKEVKQAKLIPNDAWKRARLVDGFLVLAAHPDLEPDPATFVQLYSDKNTIEMNFRTIKSILKIRPVYAHTDEKVRAHVSICMLGLLLLRSLELEMNHCQTARVTLGKLAKVNLNELEIAGVANTGAYNLTKPNAGQLAILKKLNMEDLLKEESLPKAIMTR